MLFLTANEAIVSFQNRATATGSRAKADSTVVRMTWAGANPDSRSEGVDQLPTLSNYLIGRDSQSWRTEIPNFGKVRYRDVYPGVDLLYYSERGQLEYDLILSPGSGADAIRLGLGSAKLRFDPSGDLLVRAGRGEMRFHKPVAYQPSDLPNGARDFVKVRYVRKARNQIGFEIGAHDLSRPVVIDPQLTYSSYVGGIGNDEGERIAVDSAGNAYIVGFSASLDFPTVQPLQATNQGSFNVVIAKFNPEAPGAASLVYSTYLGGSGQSIGRAIAVDALSRIYITGDTNSPNFPVTSGAYQTSCKLQAGVCSTDLFASKLSSDGSSLLYSTYLGGSGDELGFALAVDPSGHMFLAGNTGSADFPTTTGAFRTLYSGGGTPFGDAVVVELNPGGLGASDLLYSTYLGGSGSDAVWAIAVDGNGAAYVTGSTTSSNFPVTASAYRSTYSGSGGLNLGDAFVTELRPAGQGVSDLVYSTYLGGANDDRGEGIAVDGAGLVYVTGFTTSSAFPVTALTAFQPVFGGGTCNGDPCGDGILLKINPGLSGAASLLYSTFFGGNSFDLGHSLALDSAGFVYVTGETGSLNFPLVNPIQNQCAAGCAPLPMDDAFIAKFDLTRTGTAGLLFSTYFGGSNVDTGWSIAVDSKGNAYVTGQVFSTDFPTLIPYQAVCRNCTSFTDPNRSGDGFLIKVCTTNCPTAGVSPNSLTFSQNAGTTSPGQQIVFSNSGSGNLTFAGINIFGANPADFSQTNNCATVLTPLTSCTINVTFTPAAVGARAATLNVNSNFGSGAQPVSLTGTGIGPAVSLLPASLTFSNQNLNTTSALQAVTVSNSGTAALTIASIGISGINGADYFQTNNCPTSPATLAVNGVCTINVTFTPTATGSRAASVIVTDNASGSPQSVLLSGIGITPPPAAWPNGYAYQARFTVAGGQVPSAQASFPALISGTFADFKTLANSGKIANLCTQTVGTNSLSVPCDLIFTSDAAGAILLSWEFETYDSATGAVNIWVNVPSIANGAVIRAWYGNASVSTLQTTPTAAWGSTYMAVYHLKENPAGTAPQMNDSTANANHGTMNGTVLSSQQQAGKIGGSLNIAAANAWANLANPANFGFERTDSFSVSGWFKMASNSAGTLVSKIDAAATTGWGLYQFGTATTPRFALGLQGAANNYAMAATGSFSTGVWHYVVATYSGTSNVAGIKIYVDGANQTLTTVSDTLTVSIANAITPAINGRGGPTNNSSDALDEIRVSAKGVVLPPDLVTANYNNQNNPAAFFGAVTGLASSRCDLNLDGTSNGDDVQMIINEALGLASPMHDLNGDGVVNVIDIQIVINAALGLGCSAR